MTTSIDIVNRALNAMGASPINSLNEGTEIANIMKIEYEPSLIALLANNDWAFALQTMRLNKTTYEPILKYKYSYLITTDVIKIISVFSDNDNVTFDYAREADYLFSNYDSLYIKYTAKVEERFFTPSFTEALIYYLATKTVFPITKNTDLVRMFTQQYETANIKAKLQDTNTKKQLAQAINYSHV